MLLDVPQNRLQIGYRFGLFTKMWEKGEMVTRRDEARGKIPTKSYT